MDKSKQLNEDIRRQFLNKHGDCEIVRTTSWPEGLHEASKFLPDLRRPVRRTDSSDDIERHELYFDLVQKNQGKQFTWKTYCDILQANLRNSDVTVSLNKMSFQPSATPVHSCVTNFGIATGTVSSTKNLFENQISRKRSLVDADMESVSSMDDVKYQTPSKNVLKKMCTEIRILAQKTCKTVERMTTPTKYCSACGHAIRSTTMHHKCSKYHIGQSDCKKPITPGILNSANSLTSQPIKFESPTITPAFVADQRTKKFRRMPLFKL